VSRTDFEWVYTEEPHATRRKQIIAKYPEVKNLMGHDPNLKWIMLVLLIFQIVTCALFQSFSWPILVILAYSIGGVVNHIMTLGVHEISHNLAFGHSRPLANRFLGILFNIPLGIPYSVSFKKYHMLHHRYQGDVEIDMDLPSELEGKLFANQYTKIIWLILQPFFYVIRPLLIKPMPLTLLEFINIIFQIIVDVLIWKFIGIRALIYLTGSTFLSLGLHPIAGHFISEHYMFKKGFETYSYYGYLNKLTFNVGYHNEHHDFPSIPGCRLPMLKKIAPEFYDNLPHHTSWFRVLYDFVMDPDIGPYARIKRQGKGGSNNNNLSQDEKAE